jgi:hypothetical protein
MEPELVSRKRIDELRRPEHEKLEQRAVMKQALVSIEKGLAERIEEF